MDNILARLPVGCVREATSEDFECFRKLCDDDKNWRQVYRKRATCIYTKATEGSKLQIIKVLVFSNNNVECGKLLTYLQVKDIITGVTASTLMDMMCDVEYLKTWDKHMRKGEIVNYVGDSSDVFYYSGVHYVLYIFSSLKFIQKLTLIQIIEIINKFLH